MAEKRTVNLAMALYQNAKSQTLYGFRGDEVEVHEDDLERFDELNGVSTSHVNEGPHPERDLDPTANTTPAGPNPLDHGAGGPVGDFERPERDEDTDADDLIEEPAKSDPVADWRAYAQQEGIEDWDTKSKRDLIAELTEA